MWLFFDICLVILRKIIVWKLLFLCCLKNAPLIWFRLRIFAFFKAACIPNYTPPTRHKKTFIKFILLSLQIHNYCNKKLCHYDDPWPINLPIKKIKMYVYLRNCRKNRGDQKDKAVRQWEVGNLLVYSHGNFCSCRVYTGVDIIRLQEWDENSLEYPSKTLQQRWGHGGKIANKTQINISFSYID